MSSSGSLAGLLRNSRLSHVPRNSKPLFSCGPKYHPSHQVVETKPSAHYRQEWGLKAAIPAKNKSRYLVYNELDTLERITDFEPSTGSQWNRLRFQEMGVAPTYNPGRANPLFEGRSAAADRLAPLSSLLDVGSGEANVQKRLSKKLGAVKALRDEFKQWLLEKDPEALKNKSFSAKDMNQNAIAFLTERSALQASKVSKSSFKNVIGTGGLTYNLRGKLKNSPNGVVQKTIVPGRFLNFDGNDRLAAIGGFVANATSSSPMTSQMAYNMGDFIREATFPFEVQQVSVGDGGKVMIRAQVVSGISQQARRTIQGRRYQQRPVQRSRANRDAAVSAMDPKVKADELLNILHDFH